MVFFPTRQDRNPVLPSGWLIDRDKPAGNFGPFVTHNGPISDQTLFHESTHARFGGAGQAFNYYKSLITGQPDTEEKDTYTAELNTFPPSTYNNRDEYNAARFAAGQKPISQADWNASHQSNPSPTPIATPQPSPPPVAPGTAPAPPPPRQNASTPTGPPAPMPRQARPGVGAPAPPPPDIIPSTPSDKFSTLLPKEPDVLPNTGQDPRFNNLLPSNQKKPAPITISQPKPPPKPNVPSDSSWITNQFSQQGHGYLGGGLAGGTVDMRDVMGIGGWY